MGTKLMRFSIAAFVESLKTGEVFQVVQGLPKDAKVMHVKILTNFNNLADDIELEIWSMEFNEKPKELINIEVTRLDNKKFSCEGASVSAVVP